MPRRRRHILRVATQIVPQTLHLREFLGDRHLVERQHDPHDLILSIELIGTYANHTTPTEAFQIVGFMAQRRFRSGGFAAGHGGRESE